MLQDFCNDSTNFGSEFDIFGGDFLTGFIYYNIVSQLNIVKNSKLKIYTMAKMYPIQLTKDLKQSDIQHAKWLLVLCNDIIDTLDIPDNWNS